jgi:hypothetical protein
MPEEEAAAIAVVSDADVVPQVHDGLLILSRADVATAGIGPSSEDRSPPWAGM